MIKDKYNTINILKTMFLVLGFILVSFFIFFFYIVSVNALEYSVDYTRNDTKAHKLSDYLDETDLEFITNDIINNRLSNGLEYDNYALFVESDSYSTNFGFTIIQWSGDLFGVSSQNGANQPYRFSIMPSLNNGSRASFVYNLTNNTFSYSHSEIDFTSPVEDFAVVSKMNNNVSFNILVSSNTNSHIKFIEKIFDGYGMTWQEDIKIYSNSTFPYFDSTIGSWGNDTIPLYTFQVSDLFYNNSQENKFYFDDEVYSVAFYRKDLSGFKSDKMSSVEIFKFNGNYIINNFKLNFFNEMLVQGKDLYNVEKYYGLVPEISKISNVDMSLYYGESMPLVYTSEAIEKNFPFAVDLSSIPIFKKVLPQNNSRFNPDYYIEYIRDTSDYGFITFNEKGEFLNTDNGLIMEYINQQGNSVTIDLSTWTVTVSYLENANNERVHGFTAFFDKIQTFTPTISYIFSLFTFGFDMFPPVLKDGVIFLFFLGIFSYLLKLVL